MVRTERESERERKRERERERERERAREREGERERVRVKEREYTISERESTQSVRETVHNQCTHCACYAYFVCFMCVFPFRLDILVQEINQFSWFPQGDYERERQTRTRTMQCADCMSHVCFSCVFLMFVFPP